ncbi:Bax inhibitor-1 family protein [Scleromatobacter humisilvae]|uniref:Bax inhibitor-1 family protein n=1 Tax=Scleromatobacter humisilvae TaxID=2897159 RepID=A0A9X1YJE4_9BURK|nr:Bax inhibitor-1 family protein [Scleromatobacter humisilvae]MCK9686787.1 Bax inhibitor-1 family protein [Scleromatobacter humisilvae]
MDRNVQRLDVLNGGSAYGVDSQRVLRNTYWLLALSMLPTIGGAWVGLTTGIVAHMAPGMSMILFLVGAYGLMFGINATKNSPTGVFMLLGFTFFMGLMMSRLLGVVLGGYSNGASIVMTAFGGTAGVFFGMATLATVVKRDLSGLTRFLMIGAIIAIVASLINVFVQSTAAMLAISTAVMVIFSIFVMVDIKRVIDGGETNYVMATLSIYLDLYNVFQSLLILLTSLTGDRR